MTNIEILPNASLPRNPFLKTRPVSRLTRLNLHGTSKDRKLCKLVHMINCDFFLRYDENDRIK